MSVSLLASLSHAVLQVVQPLRAAAQEPNDALAFLRRLGWNTDLLDLTGLQAVSSAVDQASVLLEGLLAQFNAYPSGTPEISFDEFASFAAALQSLLDSINTVRTIADGFAAIPPDVKTALPSELLEALAIAALDVDEARGAYEVLVMVGIIDPADAHDSVPGIVASDGTVLRYPHRCDRLRLDRVGPLISDPQGSLQDIWNDAPGRTVDDLLSYLASFADRLGAEALTGIDEDRAAPIGPTAEAVSARMLTIAFPLIDGAEWGASFALAREGDDDLGLVVMPFGTISHHVSTGDWRLLGQLSGQLAISMSGSGLAVSGSAGKATFLAYSAPDAPPMLKIGGGGSTELSLSRPYAGLRLSTSVTRSAVVEAGLTASLLLSGTDSFLSAILPSGGRIVEFETGLGWAADRGIYLIGGSAGLEVELPSDFSFGPVLLHSIRVRLEPSAEKVDASLTTNLLVRVGPITASVEGLGFRARVGEKNSPLALAVKTPTGVSLTIATGPVEGGGFVSYSPDTDRYVGAMELQIGTLGLTAFGIIDTQMSDGSDGFSMLVLVTGRFTPIPIGFGFTLNALGGLLGLHRDVDVDALFAAIRAGTARDLLAPENPVRDAPRLVRQASALFPVARGQHVFGPTLQLGWGSPKQVITLDLGLVVTLPDPLRFILIGTVRAVLPDEKLAIARLNVDIAGVLDLSASRFDLEGRIFDSVIQAIPITGGFAMRSSWGRDRSFVFSIGGVHPGFTPPANFPILDRMGVDLSRGASFQFRLGGYFAITSNSLQLGARADLKVRKGGFALLADIGFDALLIFDPFGMDLQIYAGASIKRGNSTLLSLRIEARLRGPGPWQISGKASFRILFLKVSIGFSKSFGQQPSELATPVDAEALIIAALMNTRSWIEEGASHAGDIVLEGVGEALGPYSPLAVQQKVAPLELRLDQLGGRRLIGRSQFQIRRIVIAGEELPSMKQLKGAFAPAQFIKMDERERLSAPSFEDLVAGASFAGDGVVKAEGSLTADTSMEMIILDAPPPSRFPAVRLRREMVIKHQPQAASRAQLAQVPAGRIAVRSESWVATDGTLGRGEEGTYAQLRQDGHGTVLARMGEVAQ